MQVIRIRRQLREMRGICGKEIRRRICMRNLQNILRIRWWLQRILIPARICQFNYPPVSMMPGIQAAANLFPMFLQTSISAISPVFGQHFPRISMEPDIQRDYWICRQSGRRYWESMGIPVQMIRIRTMGPSSGTESSIGRNNPAAKPAC